MPYILGRAARLPVHHPADGEPLLADDHPVAHDQREGLAHVRRERVRLPRPGRQRDRRHADSIPRAGSDVGSQGLSEVTVEIQQAAPLRGRGVLGQRGRM